MQYQLAQAYTEITAARALVYNAARKKEAGQDFVQDAAMAKLYASQVAGSVSGSAVEWMGGMGFVREGIAEKMFRDSKIGAIYEGTSNIQLQTIAKLLQKQYTQWVWKCDSSFSGRFLVAVWRLVFFLFFIWRICMYSVCVQYSGVD